ncbi:MAG: molybdopterin-dependent oxidoreductase [Gammaproteobacteria bacterium]|nr:molybdopterin-dependent oxidoreductase [Gammaproteobacteria bacterium]
MKQQRRQFLGSLAGAAVAAPLGRLAMAAPADAPGLPAGAVESGILAALPGKQPLIKRSFRAPNYETPLSHLDRLYTANDAFFVRYHLSYIPRVDARSWRLRVAGAAVKSPREFSLDDLRRDFEQVEIAAVAQCSGNRRGLYLPHVPGIQWSHGAMGNARWRGVRLRDILARAGVRPDAVEVAFDGADAGVLAATPDLVKSLPVDKALDENTLVAFAMNGEPLPHWNGFPARLVVPGWTATYWIKHLDRIDVLAAAFDGYWMKSAYRLPRNAFPGTAPFASQANESTTPITSMVVNSLVTNMESGQRVAAGAAVAIRGIAWDGGHGIRKMEVAHGDDGPWLPAGLGEDAGRFSWRPWHYSFRPEAKGRHRLRFRATSHAGEVQGSQLVPNPAGYHHNLIQVLDLEVG